MRAPGTSYRQGRNRYGTTTKYGIAIHNTSNDATAVQEASYAARRPDGVSAHFYADHTGVVQSLDTSDKAGHAGSGHGNSNAIAVEITGVNGWSREKWLRSVAWDQLGAVLAAVIRHHWPDGSFQVRRASVAEMRANPRIKALYGHDDMRRAWGGTTHTDPGPHFPWDRLLAAIRANLDVASTPEDDMQLTDKVKYRTGGDVKYARPDTTVAGMLSSTNYYTLVTRNLILAETAAAKLRHEAILAKLDGDNAPAVLARIDALAAQIAADAAADAARDTALADLLAQHADGTLDADAVVARIGELLTAGSQPA